MIKINARWRNWLQIIYVCVVSYHEYLCMLRRKINRQVRYILQNLPLSSLLSKDNVFTKYSGYQICNGFIFISMLVYFFSLTIICFKHPCIHCWIIQSWNYINMIVLGCNMLYKRWHRPTSFSIGFYKYDKKKYHYAMLFDFN